MAKKQKKRTHLCGTKAGNPRKQEKGFLPSRGLSHLSHLINMRIELCFKTP